MIISWIIVTLLIALVVGFITMGVSGSAGGFFVGAWFVIVISFWIAVIYVAGHFIIKYW
jgi:hypothetical protein